MLLVVTIERMALIIILAVAGHLFKELLKLLILNTVVINLKLFRLRLCFSRNNSTGIEEIN